MFAKTEHSQLLELLDPGFIDFDWRVRESTIILVGDLLNNIAGNEGSVTYETHSTPDVEALLLQVLGTERRNSTFARIYMARSDFEHPVRQRAQMTWKGLVYNSSKMLKAILDTLMGSVITSLSSANPDRQMVTLFFIFFVFFLFFFLCFVSCTF